MDSADGGGKIPSSLHRHRHRHHHHHFYYVSPHCPFHRSILQPKNHSLSCNFSTSYPSHPNSGPVASVGPDPNLSFPSTQPNQELDASKLIDDETGELEAEQDEEPIFVLTDEWRDLFAKSEAKRRIAKKQAKKCKN